MKIIDSIKRFVAGGYANYRAPFNLFGGVELTSTEFSKTLFYSVFDQLADLVNDVTIVSKDNDQTMLFAAFKSFVEYQGQKVLHVLANEGICVIGYNGVSFRILEQDEYTKITNNKITNVTAKNGDKVYVMTSKIFELKNVSDYMMCKGWLDYANDVMNGSQTSARRLGNLLVFSPKPQTGSPMQTVLDPETKKEIETSLSKEYGALKSQKQAMVLTNPTDVFQVGLAGADFKIFDKVKLTSLILCTYFKIPANQLPIVEASAGKSLSNGGELHEGDFLKYASFERLFNHTFIRMASDLSLNIDYSIYNKPARIEQQTTPTV